MPTACGCLTAAAGEGPEVSKKAKTIHSYFSKLTAAVVSTTTTPPDDPPAATTIDSETPAATNVEPAAAAIDSNPQAATTIDSEAPAATNVEPASTTIDSTPPAATTIDSEAPAATCVEPTATTATAQPETAAETATAAVSQATAADPQTAPMAVHAESSNLISSQSGRYVAQHAAKQNIWRISTATKQSIGSRRSREDAIRDLSDLDAGCHKSQKKAPKPVATKQSARIAAAPTESYVESQSRDGNWKAGAGRGHKRPIQAALKPEDTSPTKHARDLLAKDCKDVSKLRASLQSMVDHASKLKQRCRLLVSKVATLSRWLSGDQCSNEAKETKHHLTRELIGQGYPSNTGSTLRLHRLAVMRSLQSVCGDDQLKQFQVACAVRDMFRQGESKKQKKKSVAVDTIMKGIGATFAIIAERSEGSSGRGRHKLNDRVVREVLTTAIMMAVPDGVTINALRTALGEKVDWQALRAGLDRAAAFKAGDSGAFTLDETSANAYSEEWTEFVNECWLR